LRRFVIFLGENELSRLDTDEVDNLGNLDSGMEDDPMRSIAVIEIKGGPLAGNTRIGRDVKWEDITDDPQVNFAAHCLASGRRGDFDGHLVHYDPEGGITHLYKLISYDPATENMLVEYSGVKRKE
jgi:hypothetical protein